MKDNLTTHRRGFTLIELLVVIAIIGILAGIALPTIFRTRRDALKLECQSNLRALHYALFQYEMTFHGYPNGDDYRGGKFWDALRTVPTPETSILVEDQGNRAHKYFACPLAGEKPGPDVRGYRGPGYNVGYQTRGNALIAADKAANHDPSEKDTINILFFNGQIEAVKSESPDWADANDKLQD